jgi:thiamine pyrophosphokinase
MKTIIFSNGEFSQGPWCKDLLKDCELIIAADGGARHALQMDAKVQHLIGDMDSIGLEDFNVLKSSQCKVHFFPQDKEKTDLELAMDLALEKGADEVHILGGEGGRFDHQVGNALMAASEKYKSIPVWFYSREQRSTAIHAVEKKVIKTSISKILSVIPLSESVEEFTIDGVQWPLNSVRLTLGSSFTISNRTTAEEVNISLKSGVVLLVVEDL